MSDFIAILDREGKVTRVNHGFAGHVREETLGRPLTAMVAPATIAALERGLQSVRESGEPTSVDVATPGGRGRGLEWYRMSIAPVPPSEGPGQVAVMATCITARRRQEERLRSSEEMMVDTQGAAHFGVWEWDPSEPHATWSAELYRIYGERPETFQPSYEAYLARVHPDDRAQARAATQRVIERRLPCTHDERIILPDGSLRYLHTWTRAIVGDDGALERLIGVCQDVTDRTLAEQALAERAAELAESNTLLRAEVEERRRVEALLHRAQKLEALGRLSGGIAHDFNNLLAVLLAYTTLLMNQIEEGSSQRTYLDEMLEAIERARKLIAQMLAFSRNRATTRTTIHLDAMIDAMVPLVRRLLTDALELVLDLHAARCPDEPPLVILADDSQLEQVVMNLAVNARDAMPEGGTLTIATSRSREGMVELRISDTGVGMDESIQAQMFDPFFTTKAPGRGTGLGLSTVYGIVRQHNGAIAVSSAPGNGTQVGIDLPAAPSAVGVATTQREHLGDETVLVVDDEPSVRTVVRLALEAAGYLVLEAGSGEAALRVAAERDGSLHLLLTDVVMPGMGGRELATRLQAQRPDLRLLYMTGYAGDHLGDDVGATQILRKPFSALDVATRVRAALDGPQRASTSPPGAADAVGTADAG